MMSGLYVGALGMKTHDSGLGTVSNNIANVNTIGFKQQSYLFQDMMYKDLNLGTSDFVVSNQQGLGSLQYTARTLFTQGALESTQNYTDLTIAGKGFFKVVDPANNNEYLTRAGNFVFDKEGFLVDPRGASLQAYPVDMLTGERNGGLGGLQLDVVNNAPVSPALATTSLTAQFNIGITKSHFDTYETITVPAPTPEDPDATVEEQKLADPFFSLLKRYDATDDVPLSEVPYSQVMTVYDADGKKQDLTLHFDMAVDLNGQKTMEFIATIDPSSDPRAGMKDANGNPTSKAGLLMAGTMTFNELGQLTTMSAFSPEDGADLSDLTKWKPSELSAEGIPVISIPTQNGAQKIEMNFGAKAPEGWTNANMTAADIGLNKTNLPTIGVPPELESFASTTYSGSSSIRNYNQDGATQGELTDLQFKATGELIGHFSNGKSHTLYEIPVYRVTSEDGLFREGNNYYTVTADCGLEEEGQPGTENYGSLMGSTIEISNVDMSREMVNLIVLQRGFQSNSKVVSTVDEMLQKAMELKRQ